MKSGEEIRNAVGKRYGDEVAALPEQALMGLGCGSPVRLAELREGETVVDLGSGGGIDVLLAARQVGPSGRVIGVDMTPEMLARLVKPPLREVNATTAQAIRLPLAAVLLWATPWTRGALKQLKGCGPGIRWRLAGLGALTAASSAMFLTGLKYADVAVATVLSSTAPMFAIPLAMFFLGERLTPLAVLGSIVTVLGISILRR